MFAYCNNNPVNNVDPTGKSPFMTAVLAGATIGFAAMGSIGGVLISVGWMGASMGSSACSSSVGAAQPNVIAAEHHKKGTTNPFNRKKHEQGKARKQRDHFGEKGDARRTPNPNKRRTQYVEPIEPEYSFGDKLLSGVAAIGAAAGVVYFAANDITGVGTADDGAIEPLLKIIWDNVSILFA